MNRRINIPRKRRFPYQPKPMTIHRPSGDAESFGRQVVEAMKKFEAANGKRWRS